VAAGKSGGPTGFRRVARTRADGEHPSVAPLNDLRADRRAAARGTAIASQQAKAHCCVTDCEATDEI
jgi:hypothetical protein